ncbi:hypothetical protein CYLTODRAFT_494402 [Cylindrobasidium torrendii FP15055 ss-10]|uniref:Uncharacterized protein n=1 Tax=Cylindrobasidium torrendii FP15055 ss-10 TaxID=1314674 RepID=A0A0D7AZW7_9AGAR|nr:hypothetical protein CYLTODRAFT_494402 [Cylindrobasidium torrendii FP15055 ss-10]
MSENHQLIHNSDSFPTADALTAIVQNLNISGAWEPIVNKLLAFSGTMTDLRRFTDQFLHMLQSKDLRDRILQVLVDIVNNDATKVALFILGAILIANPVGLVGFGAAGPVAGSLAALWQASMGNVAAGSLFAGLQAFGMTAAPVVLPAAGAGLWGLAMAHPVLKGWLEEEQARERERED